VIEALIELFNSITVLSRWPKNRQPRNVDPAFSGWQVYDMALFTQVESAPTGNQ